MQIQRTDKTLFMATILIVFLGLLMVYSASSVMAELKYNSSFYFVLRQSFWVVASLAVMMVLKRVPYRRLQNPALAFSGVALVVILLVVVYVLDARNHRWLRLGVLNVQPAELAKPAVVIFLAYFIAWRARAINDKHTLRPAMMAVGLLTFFVAIADFGYALVIGATAAVVFYVAGLDRRYFATLFAIGAVAAVCAVAAKPYRLARVIQFYDPHYEFIAKVDPGGRLRAYMQRSMTSRDTNYQAEQSKIAVGAGGPAGLGLMQSRQKLFYLPEAHTDFIYAVVSEELGLIGSLGILAGFGVILWRGLRAAVITQDDFGRYLALGITTVIVVQAFLNITVVLAMVPTKGIPLPMVSFGGNSLLSTLAMMGMLMNVSENAG